MSNSEGSTKDTHENGKRSSFHIKINGSEFEVPGPKISYRELVNLAFPGEPGEIIYLVQYVSPHGPDGQLQDGESVELVNGMKFDVERSHRS
jgi:hypothetical protein